jgi:hypothetical protein
MDHIIALGQVAILGLAHCPRPANPTMRAPSSRDLLFAEYRDRGSGGHETKVDSGRDDRRSKIVQTIPAIEG